MKLSQRFGAAALAIGAAVGLSGCAVSYGEEKLHSSQIGTYHCESEKLKAKVSFDTKDLKVVTGKGLTLENFHFEVVDLTSGLQIDLEKDDQWVCETPSGGITVLMSSL